MFQIVLVLSVVISLITMSLPLVMPKYNVTKYNVTKLNVTKYHKIHKHRVPRVAYGQPAILGMFPYQISLREPYNRHQYINYCGGSLLTKVKILTAASCLIAKERSCAYQCNKKFEMRDLTKLYAVAGTLRSFGSYKNDSEGTEQWRKIKNAFVMTYLASYPPDLALAYTSAPFVINKNVIPIPPAWRRQNYGSINCIVSGFGKIDDYTPSEVLRWSEVRLIPDRWGRRRRGRHSMRNFIRISETFSVLQGDYGGGLLCRNTGDPNDQGKGVIVGVINRPKRLDLRWQALFTKVSYYNKFVGKGEETRALSVFYILWLFLITINLT